MSERESIVDVVEGDPNLQKVIDELGRQKFLLEGIFHPQAYLRDTDRIKTAWGKNKSRINAIAMGVSLYNDWFYEAVCSVRTNGDVIVSKETKRALEKWEREIKQKFPSDHEEIEEICKTIGQYLEFMNRKSQGF